MTDYYSIMPLIEYAKSIRCPFIAAIGGKGNGKTFSSLKYALKERVEQDFICRYVRRYDKTITAKNIQSLCNPLRQDLINLTKGEYNAFKYWQNRFYFVRVDSNGKELDRCKKPFMIVSALNSVEMSTGADEGEISCIIYDEVLSREKELSDEFNSLMIFHSNCIRNRTDRYIPLIMLGNTFSRKSILLSDFGVNLYQLKQGEITVINNKKSPVLCIEYCGVSEKMEKSGIAYYERFNNDKVKMIYKGDWSVGNYPRCSSQFIQNSDCIFSLQCQSPSGKMLSCDMMMYEGRKPYVYIYQCIYDKEYDFRIYTSKTGAFKINESNYISNRGIFKTYQTLIFTKQCYFESAETGEMFRDFLNTVTNGAKLATVYK